MCSVNDLEMEFKRELETYRSQQVIIKALMEVKTVTEKSNSKHLNSFINRIFLENHLKLKGEEVTSLFGSKTSPGPMEAVERAKLKSLLNTQIKNDCCEVNSLVRAKKLETKFNVFGIENIKKQIEETWTEYNSKLVELIQLKAEVANLEAVAVDLKASPAQRRQIELKNLKAQETFLKSEYFKNIVLDKICDQIPGNAKALRKLKKFIDHPSH